MKSRPEGEYVVIDLGASQADDGHGVNIRHQLVTGDGMRTEQQREIYRIVTAMSRRYLPESRVSLCKKTLSVRMQLLLCNADWNCLQ